MGTIKIGILCEGGKDPNLLKEICVAILRSDKKTLDIAENINFYTKTSSGPIIYGIESACNLFCGVFKCSIVVFASDCDIGEKALKKLDRAINKYWRENSLLAKIVLALSEEEFEFWFIKENNAIASILNLGSNSIPYPDMEPKERLERLINEFLARNRDVISTLTDVKLSMAKKINVKLLRDKSTNFNNFAESLIFNVSLVKWELLKNNPPIL